MRMVKLGAVLAAVLFSAAPVSAQKSADTLRISMRDALPNVDPYYNNLRTGVVMHHQAWDTLVYRNPDTFKIEPLLATEWKTPTPTTIEFTLRPNVKFHDGTTLTADDVVYTLTVASDPNSKVSTPANYNWIEKGEKTGDLSVRVTLKRPTPAALEYFALVIPIYPKAYREKVGPEGYAKAPIGAGPYTLTKLKVRQAIWHAIDRQTIADKLVTGGSRVPPAPCFPPQFGCDPEASVLYDYNPAKAKQLLAEAGYPDGVEFELASYVLPQWGAAVQNYLQAVGIRARLNQLQVAALVQRAKAGELRLYLGSWGSYSINDVSAILPNFFDGGADDYARDPDVIKWLTEGGSSNDPEARKKAYASAIQRITEQAYWAPLHTYVTTYGHSKQLDFSPYADE